MIIYGEVNAGATWGDDADDWEGDGLFLDYISVGEGPDTLQFQTFTVAVGSGIKPWASAPIVIREMDGSLSGGNELRMTSNMISINGDEATPESLGWCPD